MTRDELLKYYLDDLNNVDITHGGNIKNKQPQRWNIAPVIYPIDLDAALTDPTKDIWLWSDTHFNHKNIIRYSNRPYTDVSHMNEMLVANYNSVVKPDDICIWGGDIGFGNINSINEYLDRCNGYKILILGNHDLHRDGRIYELEVNEIHPCMVLDVDDIQLLFTHYPMDIIPKGCIGVHGHTHTHPAFSPQHVNISVEQLGYTPINLKTVLDFIPRDI